MLRFFSILTMVTLLLASSNDVFGVLGRIGEYEAPTGTHEIPAYDPITQQLFIVNPDAGGLDVVDISSPGSPVAGVVPGIILPGNPNSVAVKNGIIAVAVEGATKQDDGSVIFYSTSDLTTPIKSVTVGALPDMLTFTPDGSKVLVANEGEAEAGNPSNNPSGSVSIIDLSGGVASATVSTADFNDFNVGGSKALGATMEDIAGADIKSNVRIHPNAVSVAADLEPEYIAVSPDGTKAYVALQENNAFAIIDLATGEVTDLVPMGTKDHSLAGNGLDGNKKDGINIQTWPVQGMFMPDAIASFEVDGKTFIISANEGDGRDPEDFGDPSTGLGDETKIEDVTLDPIAFPNAATLQDDGDSGVGIGDLAISAINGDTDGDGDFDELFSYGARSFTIWDENGNQVYDSGDFLEQLTASMVPTIFNSDGVESDFDDRSDNKGPEPEGVTIGQMGDRIFAFIGLERTGGIATFDVTDPLSPLFIGYVNDNLEYGDQAPEGMLFISAEDSPNGRALLVVSNEASDNTVIYQVVPEPTTAALGLIGLFGLVMIRRRRAD